MRFAESRDIDIPVEAGCMFVQVQGFKVLSGCTAELQYATTAVLLLPYVVLTVVSRLRRSSHGQTSNGVDMYCPAQRSEGIDAPI